MTREQWVGLAIGALAAALTILAIALLDSDAEGRVPFDCFEPTERERVRELAFTAIDEGLQKAVIHLFDVWQKDPNTDQPKRAQVGMANAVNAHNRARRFALDWNPPTCPPETQK